MSDEAHECSDGSCCPHQPEQGLTEEEVLGQGPVLKVTPEETQIIDGIIREYIDKKINKKQFRAKLVEFGQRFKDQFDASKGQSPEDMADYVMSIVPNPPPDIPFKVHVMSGDKQNDMGIGTVVALVDVWVGMNPMDLSMVSGENAEEKPNEADYPGIEFSQQPGCPKIEMADGKFVYGCQVWWEPVEEDEEVTPTTAGTTSVEADKPS